MQRFGQTPLLAFLVFTLGTGLGLAWKSGWIPVELSSANTGRLSDSDAETGEEVGSTPMTDEPGLLRLTPTDSTADNEADPVADDAIVSQSEPTGFDAEPSTRSPRPMEVPRRRSEMNSAQVTSAVHTDEPEWAAEPASPTARTAAPARPSASVTPHQAGQPERRNVRPIPSDNGARHKEIRLVANEDPPRRPNGEAVGEATPAASPLAEELAAIDAQIANAEILAAHRALSKLYWNHKESRNELLPRLEETARAIFFEPRPNFVDPYVVQPNDQLRVIASKHQLSWEYLAKLNRTDPKRLQPGQKLKIMKGPFSAIVDLNEFALTIHLQGYFVKRYLVGIGKDGASPIGKFSVLNKVDNPQYTGPDGKVISANDPLNPLGERWIDLGESYGIHGTIEPDSIGKAASRGCIRMREKDVIEVYDFLVKGSEVVIRK